MSDKSYLHHGSLVSSDEHTNETLAGSSVLKLLHFGPTLFLSLFVQPSLRRLQVIVVFGEGVLTLADGEACPAPKPGQLTLSRRAEKSAQL